MRAGWTLRDAGETQRQPAASEVEQRREEDPSQKKKWMGMVF